MQDARISTGLPSHPKTKKLIKRLGQASAWNLVCLILWAASNRSDGDLSGMTVEDIELAADWAGQDGAFVAALTEVRFLDGQDGEYMLHDWHEHNPWAAGAEMRSAKARWNAAKRHHGIAEADRLVPEYAAIRNRRGEQKDAADDATSMPPAGTQQDAGNAPSPSPSPFPSPSLEEPTVLVPDPADREPVAPPDRIPPCPTDRLIELYHRHLPMLPRVEVMNDSRRRALSARWREVVTDKDIAKTPDPRQAALEFFDWYFEHAAQSAFLTGRAKNWRADFDFLTNASKFAKVVEGHYHKEAA